MKIGLFVGTNKDMDIKENVRTIESALKTTKEQNIDMLLFGAGFLQGSISFNYENDILKASSINSEEIAKIRSLAKKFETAVGFGYFENVKGGLYSSYAVIDMNGEVLNIHRAVSKTWKGSTENADYREGSDFKCFSVAEHRFSVLISEDFLDDDCIPSIIENDKESLTFIWANNIKFSEIEWEEKGFKEYTERSRILYQPILFVNNAVNDGKCISSLAYVWDKGRVLAENSTKDKYVFIVEI